MPSPPVKRPVQQSLPVSRAPEATTTLEGEVIRVTYENAETGFRVVRVAVEGRRDDETFVGVFPPALPGTRVRATGRRTRDPKFGDQFRVDTLLAVQPSTRDGIERYLGSGMAHGVGPAWAKRIVEAFGEQTLEVLDREPERLRSVQGLGRRRAEAVAKAWSSQRSIGAIMIFLQSHGVSPALAMRIHKRFGAKAIEIVSSHPYRLALDVWGVGFKTADRIARSIGVGEDAPERAQAGVLQMLHDLTTKGHVFAERGDLVARAAAMLELDERPVDEAVDELTRAGLTRSARTDAGEQAIYPAELHDAETRLARRLLELAEPDVAAQRGASALAAGVAPALQDFERRTGVTLAPAQRAAVSEAARSKVLVVTGGPGVGKTTLVRALIALFDRARMRVRLAAPTGRAAKRMTEATGREAVTLHRLLEFDPKARTFSRRRENPVEASALIIDETSMLDVTLAAALTEAISDDARLVLVGDVDQLPSVGPGAVLREVIDSGVVPTVRLDRIFRQAEGSLIVLNAHRIHAGEMPETATGSTGEFYVIERTSPEEAAELIVDLVVNRIPRRFGLEPQRDVQVLTPMHRGAAGAVALNEALQSALNPGGASVSRGNRVLRVGDKVMQLKNSYEKEIYNGDIGVLSSIDAEVSRLKVRFDDREVEFEQGDLDELTLAYATTIHKSQGSEYPAVVIPILTSHYVMLSRNLIYTAVTRGKRLVVLVADPKAVALALAETRKEVRRTRLAELLRAGAGR